MPKPTYVLQKATKTHCRLCQRSVDLLAREDGSHPLGWFYICWHCRVIAQIGHGEVPYDPKESYDER